MSKRKQQAPKKTLEQRIADLERKKQELTLRHQLAELRKKK